tara:strand:- start:354 stop:527 length:174 start_codon:yes stop_codon:yes gene_type:complete
LVQVDQVITEIQKLLEMELQEVIQFLAQSHQPVVVAVVDLVLEWQVVLVVELVVAQV